jgi:hypothetical protein
MAVGVTVDKALFTIVVTGTESTVVRVEWDAMRLAWTLFPVRRGHGKGPRVHASQRWRAQCIKMTGWCEVESLYYPVRPYVLLFVVECHGEFQAHGRYGIAISSSIQLRCLLHLLMLTVEPGLPVSKPLVSSPLPHLRLTRRISSSSCPSWSRSDTWRTSQRSAVWVSHSVASACNHMVNAHNHMPNARTWLTRKQGSAGGSADLLFDRLPIHACCRA